LNKPRIRHEDTEQGEFNQKRNESETGETEAGQTEEENPKVLFKRWLSAAHRVNSKKYVNEFVRKWKISILSGSSA